MSNLAKSLGVGTVLPIEIFRSFARIATSNSIDFTNVLIKGGHFIIDVTAVAATPSVVFDIQGKDPVTGNYYNIISSAAITGVSTTILRVYPGITITANLSVSDVLPSPFRILATHADGDSITYSMSGILIP